MRDQERRIGDALKTIDETNKTLGRKGVKRSREIKHLPRILRYDEIPISVVSAEYKHHRGVMVATYRRVLFINKGWLTLTVVDFPYDKMTSVEYQTGTLKGELEINSGGSKSQIKALPSDQVRAFGEYLLLHISTPGPRSSGPAQTQAEADDRIGRLERLAMLKERGDLTEQEFEAEKRRILGS